MDARIIEALKVLKDAVDSASTIDNKIDMLNFMRSELNSVSPLKHHPVDLVIWEKSTNVEANDYNPNHVDKKNMDLLKHSILEDGYTMPIVTSEEINDSKEVVVKIVDGYHRRKSERTSKEISKSTFGRIPRTCIRNDKKDLKSRMASTVRHNRARGVHGIEPMSYMVVELIQMGWSDSQIAVHLGMDSDEVLRLKQNSGIAEIFKNLDFTPSWEFKEL